MTRLTDVEGAGGVPIDQVRADRDLARDIQTRLERIGLLDPPVDGQFGPVSQWALAAFCAKAGLALQAAVTPAIASALLSDGAETLFPLHPGDDTAGKIVTAMARNGHWLCRHPDCLNIVYVEGMNPDGTPNGNDPNEFNDTRLVLVVGADGVPAIRMSWEATTEPGTRFIAQPLEGTTAPARIAFGQYKAWHMGVHNKGSAKEHAALVQVEPVTIHRDHDGDSLRHGDKTETGNVGIQQHWGYDVPRKDIQDVSAGCLVGRSTKGHLAFIDLLRQDARFVANRHYTFMTTIMPVTELDAVVG